MLVNAHDMLQKAAKGHYAIGALNTNNLEWTQAILTAAEQSQTPVIVQCSMGAGKYQGGYEVVSAMVHALVKSMDITVPVVLHLDHGNLESCYKAIDAGFTSVMYDGHSEDFDTNLANTKEIVAFAHKRGISVEAEVGSIGGVEDGIVGLGESADPDQCVLMQEAGVDALACGIGNIHGKYPADWKSLRFDVLENIKKAVGDLPLVLHGGSGIPDEQVKRAIEGGVAKLNINTELQVEFADAVRQYVLDGHIDDDKGYDPRTVLKPAFKAMVAKAVEKMELCGSTDKAWN